MAQTGEPITVSLSALQSGHIPFPTLLSAFGPSSLGILIVTDLPPSFPALRTHVLRSASTLAALPAPTLASLTNPAAKYLVGWSHGVETLRPGVVDTRKGSYYLNCAFYRDRSLQGAVVPEGDAGAYAGFDEYTAPNIWPPEAAFADLGGFRDAAEELITLIIDVAVLVARACDRFAESEVEEYTPGYLEHVVRTSTTTKARLLHYFPAEPKDDVAAKGAADEEEGGGESGKGILNSHLETLTPQADDADASDDGDDWCATHLDHGCLTGLTSAMFVDESSPSPSAGPSEPHPNNPKSFTEIPSPSPLAGLYIRSRRNETVKVNIPATALAFQTGEALERITKGAFRAVPHFVRGVGTGGNGGGGSGGGGGGGIGRRQRVARNTLAVFTQPNLDELVDKERGVTFGEFARGVVGRNTKDEED